MAEMPRVQVYHIDVVPYQAPVRDIFPMAQDQHSLYYISRMSSRL